MTRKHTKPSLFLLATFLLFSSLYGQDGPLEGIEIHGNFEVYAQTYNEDSLIGAPNVPQKSGVNSFANFIATKGAFSAGARIESYMPPVQGFSANYGIQPVGVPYRYARFEKDKLDITVGNFSETKKIIIK